MPKILLSLCLGFLACSASAQVIGRVDKKTRELYIAPDQKIEYQVFGYQYPNNTTRKMICFSSRVADVKDNYNRCPLGSYFDSDKMKIGDKILYLGPAGSFAKMNYIPGYGKSSIFYLPKSSFTIK